MLPRIQREKKKVKNFLTSSKVNLLFLSIRSLPFEMKIKCRRADYEPIIVDKYIERTEHTHPRQAPYSLHSLISIHLATHISVNRIRERSKKVLVQRRWITYKLQLNMKLIP